MLALSTAKESYAGWLKMLILQESYLFDLMLPYRGYRMGNIQFYIMIRFDVRECLNRTNFHFRLYIIA